VTALPSLPEDDPVMVRRRRIAALVKVGKAVGYTALLVAIVLFFVGLATSFSESVADGIVIALGVATVVLPAPIVFGYGLRAAEREERGGRAH
jgi:archaellum biogenesis protein FlaJ (TadC family)